MKSFVVENAQRRVYVANLVLEQPTDGSITVEIKKTDVSPTARQRRLQWLWNTEVANSGIGGDDTKEAVHIKAKWIFARPILLRDCPVFGAIYAGFSEMISQVDDMSRRVMWLAFARDYISTERMSRQQRAEYLTEFQRYWIGKGVCLTDPAWQGLDQHFGGAREV
jgi:hypothetical protein